MLVVAACVAAVVTGMALAAPGDLDVGFDADGKKTIDFGGANDAGYGVVVQPDGKIVMVGSGNGNTDVAVVRMNPDGSLDASFDGDGIVGVDFGGLDYGLGVALQADGKLVVAGSTGNDVALLRLNVNGSLDASFDGDGKKTINFGGGDFARAVLVQPDGKIVVAGYGNANTDVAVVRMNPDGALDGSFDGDGIVGIDFGGSDEGFGVALQADGKLVVAGRTSVGNDVLLLRLNANGPLDANFDGDGKKTINFGGGDVARAVLVQPDGKIVIAGLGNANTDVAVVRMNPDGSPDPTFDGDGIVGVDSGGLDQGFALARQANGKLVVAGTSGADGQLVRLNGDGSLDLTFDFDAKKTIDFGGTDTLSGVALQGDGRIVVVGYTSGNVQIARVEGDPPPPPPPAAPPPAPAAPPPAPPGTPAAPRCQGAVATIVGTNGSDRLRGTAGNDVIVALGGNDNVKAGGGDDLVCAGAGNDTVVGGGGSDTLLGNGGADTLQGKGGDDTLRGGAGPDRLLGGPGTDSCAGAGGVDAAAACETLNSVP